MSFHGYAALAKGEALLPHAFEPTDLGPADVEVKISYCGVCHTDIHLIDNDWGNSRYPIVPGHEIIGTVEAVGPDVQRLRVGQRVGIGYQSDACLECYRCIRGDENLCKRAIRTCVGRPGGFADKIRVSSHFVFPIPDKLGSETAAPLLCGGITVYAPLRHYGVLPSMRVGIIGVGGVGHLGIQLASAFGCEVTAFSSSPEKEAEARELGADKFICIRDNVAMGKANDSLDFILSTVHADLNWMQFVTMLRVDGKLCLVGVPQQPISVPAGLLLSARRSICGSLIGSRVMMHEMLDFAARHDIRAKTETMPIAQVNEALDKVRKNRARYRMVLAL